MGIFSPYPCWIALCFFRIMAAACWDRPDVWIFSPTMFMDNRWTWEKGQWADHCWNAHFYNNSRLECSSCLSPTSPERPAVLGEEGTCWLSLCLRPGTAASFPAEHPGPRGRGTARAGWGASAPALPRGPSPAVPAGSPRGARRHPRPLVPSSVSLPEQFGRAKPFKDPA